MGLTYRGLHSARDLHVAAKVVSRPVCPPVRTVTVEIPGRDGSLDYSEELGRLYYDDKVVEVEFSVISENGEKLNRRISQMVGWLVGGYGDLIFDDMPLVAWRAKPVKLDDIAHELGRVGRTTVQFRCEPFNSSLFLVSGVQLDDDIPIDSEMLLDDGASPIPWSGTDVTFNFDYAGTAPVRPVISVTGGSRNQLELTVNDVTLRYTRPCNDITFDCEDWTATADGVDVTEYVTGDYPELTPGENVIHIVSDKSGAIEFDYFTKYLYGTEMI